MKLDERHKKKISEGTYGIVYGFNENNHQYVVKRFKKSYDKNGFSDDFVREIFHYSQPYSKINIYEFTDDSIVLDQFTTDLYGFIEDKKYTGTSQDLEEMRQQILLQIYLTHSYGFLHSDIKLSNILFHKVKNIYSLCDYGLTEFYGFPAIKKRHQCTSYFKPLRRVQRNTINLDIYSLGCVLYYLEGGLSIGYTKNLITRQIDEKHKDYIRMVSAKFLLNMNIVNNTRPFLEEIVAGLGMTMDENNIPVELLDKPIFADHLIKNGCLYNYSYREIGNELDYIEDMFLMYYVNPVLVGQNSHIDDKLKMLDCYMDSSISPETLLFAWLIISVYPQDENSTAVYKIVLNFSCKVLEYYNYTLKSVDSYKIKYVELILLEILRQRQVILTPVLFFLYYYLYKLAKACSKDYYIIGARLESLGLSFIFLYFLDPKLYREDLTYNELVKDIIKLTIDFLKDSSKIDCREHLVSICLENSKWIPEKMLQWIVPDMALYYFLQDRSTTNTTQNRECQFLLDL